MKKLAILVFVFLLSTALCAQERKNRIDAFLGVYVPSGEVEFNDLSFDLKTGGSLGVAYHYALNKYIRIGGFFDVNAFSSETETVVYVPLGETADMDFDVSTAAIGVSLELGVPIERFELYGRANVGPAFNSLTVNIDWDHFFGKDDDHDNGVALYLAFEGGARYHINELIDLGLGFKYVRNRQKFDDIEKLDLGGISVTAAIGFTF